MNDTRDLGHEFLYTVMGYDIGMVFGRHDQGAYTSYSARGIWTDS